MDIMTTIFKKIIFAACIAALALPAGCIKDNADDMSGKKGGAPEGYVKVNFNFITEDGKSFQTRASSDPMLDFLDDVHLFIFEDVDDDGIDEHDLMTLRDFYEYGVQQNIYLKKNQAITYYAFAIANLDDSNCPNGNVDTYFDDVVTYGDLQKKYVQFNNVSPSQTGKVIMSSSEALALTLGPPDNPQPGDEDVFTPDVIMSRVQTKFIVNIFNRVTSAGANLSKVHPSTMYFVNVPQYSYLMGRTTDYAYTPGNLVNVNNGYYSSPTDFIPDPTGSPQLIGGDYYTRQTIEYYSFENRRGTVNLNGNVYNRFENAPQNSTYFKLTSITDLGTLLTYVHAGQGRNTSTPTPTLTDNINDYNVERNCIYHFNIYIKDTMNVTVDTRREFIQQLVDFTLPPDANRLDAHYIDLPSFIKGSRQGYVKLQSGIARSLPNGELIYDGSSLIPRGWKEMKDTDADSVKWLRFSWHDPYDLREGPINTSMYVGMAPVDGVSTATPILHLNEYVNNPQKAVIPAVNPPRRTAAVRIGFVAGATTPAEYEAGVDANREDFFFYPVIQYGLKTIGQVGGYESGIYGVYTSLLGVESVEEYRIRYYSKPGAPHLDAVTTGNYWRYTPTNAYYNHNQAYNGAKATREHYNHYRNQTEFGGVPPVRWQPVYTPQTEIYNPVSKTNAMDYCARKNRDENGDGIIDSMEMKWYMPTPVQVMQMYSWRKAFKYGAYTLNGSDVPFRSRVDGDSDNTWGRYYWTTNEVGTTNVNQALAVDFWDQAALSATITKTDIRPIRCVRDIDTDQLTSAIYISGGKVVADLSELFPLETTVLPGTKVNNNNLNKPENNTLARKFIISRWYVTSNSNHSGNPSYLKGNNGDCSGYTESSTSTPSYTGTWQMPSQQELSFIYAYAGMINTLLQQTYGTATTANRTTTYYPLMETGAHWAITNVGNNSTFWSVDFGSGYAGVLKKTDYSGYFRCVTYTTADLPRDGGLTP